MHCLALTGKEKRRLQRQQLAALGGKLAGEARMPLKKLQGLRKKRKEKAVKEAELVRL